MTVSPRIALMCIANVAIKLSLKYEVLDQESDFVSVKFIGDAFKGKDFQERWDLVWLKFESMTPSFLSQYTFIYETLTEEEANALREAS